jgi:tungstate transport system permease protein
LHDFLHGFEQAIHLLLTGEAGVWEIMGRSLAVSGLSVLIGCLLGIPLGAVVGLRRFPGRRMVVSLLNLGMGLPPVVVGLFVYLLLSRSGPLGFFHLLYTPGAMIVAQTILATPIIAALTFSAIAGLDPAVRLTARALGASERQATLLQLGEARFALGAAVIAGFGAVISEVGAVYMVGGSIPHFTRVMTTAIMLETSKGDFTLAIALGIVLLFISLLINIALSYLQTGRRGI